MIEDSVILSLYNQLFDDVKQGDLIDEKREFVILTYNILKVGELTELKDVPHHRRTSRLMHSLHVSFYCYLTCKKRGWDYKSATRGALLHDFFRIDKGYFKRRVKIFLGLYHPRMAMNKALQFFDLNEIEKECILRHMFPLTLIPAKHKEAWTVILWDKVWGTKELLLKEYTLDLATCPA